MLNVNLSHFGEGAVSAALRFRVTLRSMLGQHGRRLLVLSLVWCLMAELRSAAIYGGTNWDPDSTRLAVHRQGYNCRELTLNDSKAVHVGR
jgi:hypothetical protein